jgi:peptidoglycan/xylan/chitin deacetylase (PgdA/CDA1 family)
MARYAGVAWGSDGYHVEVVDEQGSPSRPAVYFGPGRAAEIGRFLHDIADVVIVDSTSGVVDGGLVGAGLDVYRADPWQLPPRPDFGSVAAMALAEAGRRDLGALTRMTAGGGSLVGRIDEFHEGMERSEPAVRVLTEAGRCITRASTEEPIVTLTFDDGPNPPYTNQILDILARFGVPATFFCIGLNASAYPDVVARQEAEGHTIGNHTWSHPFLPDLSQAQLGNQLDRTYEALAGVSTSVSRYFRPPYGSRTPDVMSWLTERDDTVVLWDIDPRDWSSPGTDAIVTAVFEQVRPGSILLMHDGGGNREQTVAALPAVIEGLLERGYRFVPLASMFS